MPDVAIVIGHNKKSKGAEIGVETEDGEWKGSGVFEHDWNTVLAEVLLAKCIELDINAKVYHRSSTIGYEKQMRKVCAEINADDPALVLSLHFNALPVGSKGTLKGATALHWPGSKGGERAAAIMAKYAGGAIGNHSRGIRGQSESWAGVPLYILQLTKSPAVILEPFFGDHPDDAEAATDARDNGILPTHLAMGFAQLLRHPAIRR